jgi:hypothetical protein
VGSHPQAVQKVSAAFAAGSSFSHGVGSFGSTSVSYSQYGGFGVSSGGGTLTQYEERYTGLATLLAPPGEPRYQTPWGLVSRIWVGFWLVGFLVLPDSVRNSAAQGYPQSIVVVFDVLFLLAMIVPVIWRKQREVGRRKRLDAARRRRWESLMTRWDDAFYCHKDGVVFEPGQGLAVPAPEFALAMTV